MNITIEKTTSKRERPTGALGFGNYFTDHMFIMDYTEGKGWHDARIVPYAPVSLDPAAMVLHYGQEIFEGLKAYKSKDGSIQLFRPEENAKRMNLSGERLAIPAIDEKDWVEAVRALVEVDKDWVPEEEGTSLYIRPFTIACDPFLGVRASNTYQFIIILSPVGAYYPEGLDPVSIAVETEFVRAVKGGTGFTKCGGNYAASIIAQMNAKKAGYAQVLWLDGVELKYIEEVGTMNVFFKIAGKVFTPALGGTILPGITRKSVMELSKTLGFEVTERQITLSEVVAAAKDGTLEEMFGSGTAAVVSPVGRLLVDGVEYTINNSQIGDLSQKLYDTLTGIQWGTIEDSFGWVVKI